VTAASRSRAAGVVEGHRFEGAVHAAEHDDGGHRRHDVGLDHQQQGDRLGAPPARHQQVERKVGRCAECGGQYQPDTEDFQNGSAGE